jgi:hypothetical protein
MLEMKKFNQIENFSQVNFFLNAELMKSAQVVLKETFSKTRTILCILGNVINSQDTYFPCIYSLPLFSVINRRE